MKHLFNAYIKTYLLSLVLIIISAGNAICQNSIDTDVLIIGGGASGTAAGVQAARMGAQTIIIEESPWVGGMLTAAGVSAIDGNHKLPAGMWGEFRDALIKHYGSAEALQTGWVSNVQFEPSVGNKIFQELISAEKNLRLFTQTKLSSLRYNKGKWNANVANNNTGEFFSINASIVIDATELGDIAKMTGVKYDIGMESRHDTREDIAPENSNGIIQDLTYVAVLKDYGKDVTINRPDGYDASNYACCSINELCTSPSEPDRMWSPEMMITYGKLPGNKYMINWPIEGNDFYLNIIEASPQEREKALTEAKNFTLGFIYFMQTELGFNTLGLADDEFPTDDLLPFMPYHRESRRIHGLTRFTLNHIVAPYDQAEALYRTSIAVGDYPVDHHHARYTGQEELPRLYFHPVPSFGLPLGTLIPQDVDNLIVAEKSISVSNIVNGTTRLQPVVLQIGTAAGTLAALAASQGKSPADVSVREVQRNILDAGGYLLPFLDVDKNDDRFKSYQRIGATGILKGEGRNMGWENQTWLRADSLLMTSELDGLREIYPAMNYRLPAGQIHVTIKDATQLLKEIAQAHDIAIHQDIESQVNALLTDTVKSDSDLSKNITRGEFAILLDRILNPFDYRDVTIDGRFITKE